VQLLAATDLVEVAAGDAIVIETPGGGGWGRA
jgi:5-oxoprolinase (ATP-hydrolysing)